MYRSITHVLYGLAVFCWLAPLLTLFGCEAGGSEGSRRPDLLGQVFPGPVRVQPLPDSARSPRTADEALFEVQNPSGRTIGYAAELQVASRSGPFRILVALDTQRCVREVRILRYTAQRGRGVLSMTFTSQFRGKCPQDPIRVGADIDAVTGATLSARAVADGVRRAIELVDAAGRSPVDAGRSDLSGAATSSRASPTSNVRTSPADRRAHTCEL
jgi:hypothetical protein